MNCNRCGNPVDPNSSYCNTCGNQIIQPTVVPQTNNTVNIPQEPYQSPSASDTLQTGGTY